MNEKPDPPPATTSFPAPESVAGALLESMDDRGPVLLQDPAALRQLLLQRCAAATTDIDLLMAALAEQVPQTLLALQPQAATAPLLARLEARLRDRRSLNPYAARWAVQTWADVLAAWTQPLSTRGGAARPAPTVPSTDEPASTRPTAVASESTTTDASSDARDAPTAGIRRPAASPGSSAPRVAAARPVRVIGGSIGAAVVLSIAWLAWPGRTSVPSPAPAVSRPAIPTNVASRDIAPAGPIATGRVATGAPRIDDIAPAPIAARRAADAAVGAEVPPSGPVRSGTADADACRLAHCGRVVASRRVPGHPRDALYSAQVAGVLGIPATPRRDRDAYDVVVRLDDRTERAFRRSVPIAVGTRVRIDGRRLVATDQRGRTAP